MENRNKVRQTDEETVCEILGLLSSGNVKQFVFIACIEHEDEKKDETICRHFGRDHAKLAMEDTTSRTFRNTVCLYHTVEEIGEKLATAKDMLMFKKLTNSVKQQGGNYE